MSAGASADAAMAAVKAKYVTTRVYFATDRDYTMTSEGGEFGSKRSAMRYGTCLVSIPSSHQSGVLEAPQWWKFGFEEDDAKKYIVVRKTLVQSQDVFFSALANRADGKNAFLFVHGFDTTFFDAAKRTAQMAFDLNFKGAPVFFSWPSRGTALNPLAYTSDEDSVQWAEADLEKFLGQFFDKSNADHIYLIAHSMGNRALTRALAAVLRERPNVTRRFTEVILTAPDIDAELFRTQIAPALTASHWPITLYASSADAALEASRKIHGDPRAGDAGAGLVVLPGIDTIDASAVDTSLTGHSYYGDSRSVLSDLFYLIRDGTPPDGRFGLRRVNTKQGHYWVFVP